MPFSRVMETMMPTIGNHSASVISGMNAPAVFGRPSGGLNIDYANAPFFQATVFSPVAGKVSIQPVPNGFNLYQVKIVDAQGYSHILHHLSYLQVQQDMQIQAGQMLGSCSVGDYVLHYDLLNPLGQREDAQQFWNNPEQNGPRSMYEPGMGQVQHGMGAGTGAGLGFAQAAIQAAGFARDFFTSAFALDLDKDGLEAQASLKLFDTDGDGVAEAQPWLGAGDAWLVRDLNQNGKIDNGQEMFSLAGLQQNRYATLEQLDSNQDGLIDNQDSEWQNLQLWRDANQDGQSQPDELLSTQSADLRGIALPLAPNSMPGEGDIIHSYQTRFATSQDTGVAGQFHLQQMAQSNLMRNFVQADPAKPNPHLAQLRGSGWVPDLQSAIAAQPPLESLLNQYIGNPYANFNNGNPLPQLLNAWADTARYGSLQQQIAGHGTVNYQVDGFALQYPETRDSFLQKLGIVERFMGLTFQEGWARGVLTPFTPPADGSSVVMNVSFNQNEVKLVLDAYNALLTDVSEALLLQTRLLPLQMKLEENLQRGAPAARDMDYFSPMDVISFVNAYGGQRLQNLGVNPAELVQASIERYTNFDGQFFHIDGSTWNVRTAVGQPRSDQNTLALASSGSPHIEAGAGNDTLIGNNQDNTMHGGSGNDLYLGGAGNDTIFAGNGINTYVYGKGDGNDHILAMNSFQNPGQMRGILQFQADIDPQRVSFEAYGADLHILLHDVQQGGTQRIVVGKFFDYQGQPNLQTPLHEIQFANGSTWQIADILPRIAQVSDYHDMVQGTDGVNIIQAQYGNDSVYAGAGNDSIAGNEGDDLLQGEAGDDILRGDAGNDTLIGGSGNDTLISGAGQDEYRWGASNGHDRLQLTWPKDGNSSITIALDADVVATDIAVTEQANNLHITLLGKDASFELQSWRSEWGNHYTNVYLRMPNGKLLMMEELIQMASSNDGNNFLIGTQGDDGMNGQGGDDELLGRFGNDTLLGGNGNDSLSGEDGQDILRGEAGNDTLSGGNERDLLEGGIGQDWLDGGSGNDTLVGGADEDQLMDLDGDNLLIGNDGKDHLIGGSGNSTLEGGSGNDWIFGGWGNELLQGDDGEDMMDGSYGNDTLNGGNGNDILTGNFGNDLLQGGAGNNTYHFALGHGVDQIASFNSAVAGKLNTLQFASDIRADMLQVSRSGNALVFSVGADQISAQDYFASDNPNNPSNPLQQVKFADGSIWNMTTLNGRAFSGTAQADTTYGTIHADNIYGLAGNDFLNGRGGADLLVGGEGHDQLYGEGGNDTLRGDNGNDTLEGGYGNDVMTGGLGNNTYIFSNGYGQDVIQSTLDSNAARLSTLHLRGITPSNPALKLNQVGNDLKIQLANVNDHLTVRDFYLQNNPGNLSNPVQQIRFADNTIWKLADIVAHVTPQLSVTADSGFTNLELTGQALATGILL